MMLYIKLALQYLNGRKLRSALTTLSIVLGVMLIFGLNGLLPALSEPFKKSLMASANQVDLIVTNETGSSFDESAIDKASTVQGIDSISGAFSKSALLPESQALKTSDGKTINLLAITGIVPDTYRNVRRLIITAGSPLTAKDDSKLLISENLSEKTGLKIGSKITLPSSEGSEDFTITGIYKGAPTLENEEIFSTLASVQKLFNQGGRINSIDIMFKTGVDREIVKSQILDALGKGYKAGSNEGGNSLMSIIELSQKIFNMFGFIALVMSGFIIFITFRTIVAERKRDIGLLRAIGATKRKIVMIILTEGILQGITGSALGMLSGYLLVKAMLNGFSPMWQELMNIPMGKPAFDTTTILTAIFLGIGVTVIAGLMPAFSAGKVTALEALRPSRKPDGKNALNKRMITGAALIALSLLIAVIGGKNASAPGWLLFTIGLIICGPSIVKPVSELFSKLIKLFFVKEGLIAQGNLENHPRRAAMTAVTVMIGLALIISLFGVFESLSKMMNDLVEESLGSDYLILPQSLVLSGSNVGIKPEFREIINNLPGIATTTSLRIGKTRAKDTDFQVIGIDPVSYPQVSGLSFSSGNEKDAYKNLAKGRNIIINGILASTLSIKTGDTLEMSTPEGTKNYTVVGIAMDFLNAKITTGYISQDNLSKDFREQNDVTILADKDRNADEATVKAGLEKLMKNYPAYKLLPAIEFKKSMLKDIKSAISLMGFLLFAIAIPSLISLINTLGIAVIERTRELGVMRAVGATRKQIKNIITAESILLAGIGTLFGVISGTWLGYVLVYATNNAGFKIVYQFPIVGLITGIATGLIFGLLGASIPARHAARLKIVEALKYE